MRLISVLLIVLVISACTHVSTSLETPEEKEARLAAEKKVEADKIAAEEKAEADRVAAEKKAEQDIIHLKMMKKSINSSIEKCSAVDDELNRTFCFAEQGVKLMRQGNNSHPVYDAEYHPVYNLCEYADDRDLCYFYAAVTLNGPGYCKKVKDETGCKLLSDPLFCTKLINPNECLLDRATLIRFISLQDALKTCALMKRFDKYPDAKKNSCDELDLGRKEYDDEPYRDRFFMMYVMTKLTGFEVNKTTVSDYARKVVRENE